MAAKKRKLRTASTEAPRTTRNAEGFYEPFNIDTVPWRKASASSTAFKRLGRYGGGSQVGVGMDLCIDLDVASPTAGLAAVHRALGP